MDRISLTPPELYGNIGYTNSIVERIPIGLDVYSESTDPLKDTWENFVLPHVNKEDLDHYKTLWNTIVRKGPSLKPKL